jgi:hypothetical protein
MLVFFLHFFDNFVPHTPMMLVLDDLDVLR